MAYNIRKSDGTLLLELSDGFTDNTTSSLIFIGKNVSNFGEIQNNNLLHLLENFSALTEPANKITGQLWFDKTNNVIKVFNTDKWQTISVLSYSASSTAASSIGNLWYDTINHQLSINTGTGFRLIGPESVPGFGVTKLVSTTLTDLSNITHPVIKIVINNEIIGIISNTSFDINSTNGLTGFPYAYKGVTFKNGTTNEVQLYGWSKFADAANKLKNDVGNFVYASTVTTANSIVQRDSFSNIKVNGITASSISTSTTGIISGIWSVNNGVNPTTNGSANLGTSLLRWSNVYAQTINATQANATTVKFSNITDSNLASITQFDNDAGMSANSDSRLATQRAIKKYIDDAVALEVQSRITADTGLQNQINGFQGIPSGTVFYTAGNNVPFGFLAVIGQSLSKNTYANLYAAIGGIYGQTSTTFNLPDLRGEFIRGWDAGRGVESRNLGSFQNQSFASHTHPYVDTYYREAPKYGGNGNNRGVGSNSTDYDNSDLDYQRTTSSTGGSETRPRNVALYAIIKY
jgi:microcystin-dependent protein